MKRITVMFLVFLLLTQTTALSDKIYLKSGDILNGKIMERRDSWNPARDYCDDWNDIVVLDSDTYRCIPKENILKVEKEFRKPEGVALLAKDNNWGEHRYGYVTQLISQSKEYIVGKPMNFGLILKNIGDSVKFYDHQAITHNTLMIKNTEGEEPYYKKGPFQTCGEIHPIDMGEVVTLFENRDITEEYVIMKPGKYTIQFREGNYGMSMDSTFPASNIIEFEIKPGSPSKEDLLLSLLVSVIPDQRWYLARSWCSTSTPPAGREKAGDITQLSLLYLGCSKKDVIIVQIWLTSKPLKLISVEENISVSEYLGENSLGHVYILIPSQAKDYWPMIRQDISQALSLKILKDEFKEQTKENSSVKNLIDLNTATRKELMSIKGIGYVLSERIIAGRPYKNVDDLLKVKGIGPKTLEKVRPYFVVK